MELSESQKKAIEKISKLCNVLITGPAGTGKTTLIDEIKKCISADITAMTGIAALKIGGSTLHSWSGMGLANGNADDIWKKLSRRGRDNITRCTSLIIDEISMCNDDLMDKFDFVAKKVKDNDKPFGGIQMILLGDFYQLPPVSGKPVLSSKALQSANFHLVRLTEIFRQKEPYLINILGKIRIGNIDESVKEYLELLKRPLNIEDGILPTKLYCRKTLAVDSNFEELKKLPSDEVVYKAQDFGDQTNLQKLNESCQAQSILTLKKGAQVMMIKNNPPLYNGSRGVVVGFLGNIPIVKFSNGEFPIYRAPFELRDGKTDRLLAERVQIPLILAWAITIHKAQGLNIDRLEVYLDDAFAYGQVYTALSRATSSEGLRVALYDIAKILTI